MTPGSHDRLAFSPARRPTSIEALDQQLAYESSNVSFRDELHGRRAAAWDSVASVSRLLVAFTAAASTISIFADSTGIAAVFAAVTAAVSAFNAAFNPAETAKTHRDASRAYRHFERPLGDLQWNVRDQTSGAAAQWSAGERDEVWKTFAECRAGIELIEERAPTIRNVSAKLGRYIDAEYAAVAPPL